MEKLKMEGAFPMQRNIKIFLALLMVLTLAACSQTDGPQGKDKPYEAEAILTAKVIDIKEMSILLASMAEDAGSGDIYRISGDKIDIITDNGNKLDIKALKRGMLVDVAFDGMIQESFPMGLGGVKGIYIKSQREDIPGLYKKVIEDLYKVDPGLNDNINIMAFDLTGVVNMTEAEKTALIYLIAETYGLETIAGTYEELSEQGYINKEQFYFEKGLLFTIEDELISGDSFSFNAEKWRSGTGAYIFYDCKAVKSQDGWSYTIGAEMIS
ncbi:MAG: hypothetical protein ACOYJ1_04790 [Peptococcales bacterium]|jgi:hypothetical protein